MSRLIALVTTAVALGVVVADFLFYEHFPVPAWLNITLWGWCLLQGLIAWCCWRSERRSWQLRVLFPLSVFLFFAAVGVSRYASYAASVQEAWQHMAHRPVNHGNPDEFDYVRWCWLQGVEDSTSGWAQLRRHALAVRERLVDAYVTSGMDIDAQAIIVASTLGDRSLLRPETRELYAAAGASHLLALSGLHLSIIVGFFVTLLNARFVMSRWRPWLGGAVVLFIWLYAFVAGLPTSLVRASLMTTLFLIGALQQRYVHPLHWLVLTALVMLILRPVYLFDVGAQLSFAAVAGIVVLHRRWQEWCFLHWRFQVFWLQRYHLMWPLTLLTVSLSAQLATLPLVAYYFHRLPTYASLFSVVYIPLTTILIYIAFALLLFSLLASLLPLVGVVVPLLGRLLSWLVVIQLGVMKWEVRLPGAVVDDFWSRKAEPQVVVYNNRRCPALHVIASPEASWLLMPQPDSVETGMRYIAESFWRRRLTEQPHVLRQKKAVAVAGFQAVMIDGAIPPLYTLPLAQQERARTPMKVDFLWLTKGFEGKHLGALTDVYHPRLLVLDACLKVRQRDALKADAERVGWRVYDVAERGAMKWKLPAVKDGGASKE